MLSHRETIESPIDTTKHQGFDILCKITQRKGKIITELVIIMSVLSIPFAGLSNLAGGDQQIVIDEFDSRHGLF